MSRARVPPFVPPTITTLQYIHHPGVSPDAQVMLQKRSYGKHDRECSLLPLAFRPYTNRLSDEFSEVSFLKN
ncbi:unnamed protein product, partial [Mesorhabditis belari]|uniref:Uncharacterized protein n=1 Tax=Mesorhabditis belari TaxID=2138241 RepID=A0AAF3EJY4_9BILA